MKAIIILAFLGLCAAHMRENEEPFVTKSFVDQQKFVSSFETYTFEEHPFKNWSKSELQGLLGLSPLSLRDTSKIVYNFDMSRDLPENFDSREQWPECIHPIRDQGHCGSCWAHAASEVLSDRFCIASQGKINVVLSPQDFVSCDWLDHGCNGGILTTSWVFLEYFGLVTDDCKPYVSGNGKVPWCPLTKSQCTAPNVEYKKYKASTYYSLSSIDEIKRNLYEKGPVETGFTVYSDFMNYKSGIYKKSASASVLGGHAVKIVGWGKENDTEFWIVANSWGTTWGENGHFRIAFRECGIENCIAGDPKL
jgi:cathepsin B